MLPYQRWRCGPRVVTLLLFMWLRRSNTEGNRWCPKWPHILHHRVRLNQLALTSSLNFAILTLKVWIKVVLSATMQQKRLNIQGIDSYWFSRWSCSHYNNCKYCRHIYTEGLNQGGVVCNQVEHPAISLYLELIAYSILECMYRKRCCAVGPKFLEPKIPSLLN